MPQERSEVHEAAVWIDALSIPPKQRGYGKRVPQVMESGRRYARWNMQLQFGQESMKSLTDCSFVDAATLREGEQRQLGCSIAAVSLLYVALETQRQIGTQASVITSKAANDYHFKTGQRK